MSAASKKKHPLAGQEMTGAEMVLQVLRQEGVDTIFGYSGGAILPTYDALYRHNASATSQEQIKLIVPANEQGAGFMAAGYARATGKVGCFMVTSGPGATNCATPIRDCAADSVPVVLICGQVPYQAIGSDAFQEAPVYSVMGACAKHTFLVSNGEDLEATIRTAFAIARGGRPGPVVIDVPKDVQNYKGVFKGEGMLTFHGYMKRLEQLKNARLTKQETADFFRLLGQSERPLLYVGGGVINANAAQELRTFAKHFGIPVVTTLTGIGSADTSDDTNLHLLGMHGTACANYAVLDSDLLIAVGARFDDRVAGKVAAFAPNAKVMHIDIDAAEISKVKGVDWSHVGDAKRALKDLFAAGKTFKKDFKPWLKYCAMLKKEHWLAYDQNSDIIQPEMVIEMLSNLTKGDAIVCTGVGQHQIWAAQYGQFHQPRTYITSASMGTMGFGLPASIGAKVACPDKLVIDVDGDGSLRMNVGEMETAATYGIGIKLLLLNNQADGMVRQWQHLFFDRRFAATCKASRTKDFVKAALADGFGFAKRVTDKKELKTVMKQWLDAEGPALLEVMVDRDAKVYPMVGPGLGYEDMITGPHIKPREEGKEDKLDTADSF